jgi:superoxide dismutase
MKLHHQKHHQTYVNGLNAAEEAYVKSKSIKEQISLQSALKFNGGGEYAYFEQSRLESYLLHITIMLFME